ncbi:MAG: putative manganese transporter [Prevotellaceae bacterium]|nr:putative manganese transporter [Prevotellaceae bacterium]
MLSHAIIHILQNTAFILGLVMTMLLLVEYANATARSRGLLRLKQSPLGQLLVAALLGMIPGCIGGFAVVALFAHGVVSFGALVAAMVAAMGDEAFVMYASFPLKALMLQGILLAAALASGGAVNLLWKNRPAPAALLRSSASSASSSAAADADAADADADAADAVAPCSGNERRHRRHEEAAGSDRRESRRRISLRRAALAGGLLLFMAATVSGALGHSHGGHGSLFGERHINLFFLILAAAALAVVVRVDERFLERHLWRHVLKKHFVRILLWTLGALIAIAVLNRYIEAQAWVRGNQRYMLVAAMLIGFIPASGPHLVFVLLFAQGSIPFSVLLANTIMQDGHAGIPLLAESKRGFICMKAVKGVAAAGAGACGMLLGF